MQQAPRTPRQRKLDIGLGALAVFTLTSVGAALAWDAQPAQSTAAPQYTPPATPVEEPVEFAAVGDSITAANSESIADGRAGNNSWAYYADQGNVDLTGGWAEGGATTKDMAANVDLVAADVLVILAGTNDIGQDVPFRETTRNLKTIVDTVGVDRVVVSSVPPRDDDPGAAAEFNEDLEAFVSDQGWEWVDAAAVLRDGETYKDGLTEDGVHPTQQGQKLLGAELRRAITAN